MPLVVGDWLRLTVTATRDVADNSLACSDFRHLADGTELPESKTGALVTCMVPGRDCLHMGLFSDDNGLTQLARGLFAMEPDEEDPEEEDVLDAAGEIVNIVAGMIKTTLGDVLQFELGLPIYIRGNLNASGRCKSAVATVSFDDVTADIVVIHGCGVHK